MRSILACIGLIFFGFSGVIFSEEEVVPNLPGLDIASEIVITVGDKPMSFREYVAEYVTTLKFDFETRKFKVNRCNQEKRHHTRGKSRRPQYQWMTCDVCGRAFKGHMAALEHADSTGHKYYHRIPTGIH